MLDILKIVSLLVLFIGAGVFLIVLGIRDKAPKMVGLGILELGGTVALVIGVLVETFRKRPPQ